MRIPFKRQPAAPVAPKPRRPITHTEWVVAAACAGVVLLANHPHPKVQTFMKHLREALGDAASQL